MNLRTYLRIKTAASDPMWVDKAMADGINRYNDLFDPGVPPVKVRNDPIQEMKRNLAEIRMDQAVTAGANADSGGYLPYYEWHQKYGTEPKVTGKIMDIEAAWPSPVDNEPYEPMAIREDKYNRLVDQAMLDADYGDYIDYANKNKK